MTEQEWFCGKSVEKAKMEKDRVGSYPGQETETELMIETNQNNGFRQARYPEPDLPKMRARGVETPPKRPQYKSTLTLPDVEYNITRLEGQLVRLQQYLLLEDPETTGTDTVLEAKKYLAALRLALSKDRIDVT